MEAVSPGGRPLAQGRGSGSPPLPRSPPRLVPPLTTRGTIGVTGPSAGAGEGRRGGAALRPAGACLGRVSSPRRKAACQSGQRKLRARGARPSPASLLGSGTGWPRPGCAASPRHQRMAGIPFLRELPRAPGKGDAKRGPSQGRSSPGGVVLTPAARALSLGSEGRSERGRAAAAPRPGRLPLVSKVVQGVSQPLPNTPRCHVNSMGPRPASQHPSSGHRGSRWPGGGWEGDQKGFSGLTSEVNGAPEQVRERDPGLK